jgi:hypothetical protein
MLNLVHESKLNAQSPEYFDNQFNEDQVDLSESFICWMRLKINKNLSSQWLLFLPK